MHICQLVFAVLLISSPIVFNAQNIGFNTPAPQHPLQVNVDQAFTQMLTDQSCPAEGTLLQIYTGERMGQGFIAGLPGNLRQLVLKLGCNTSADVRVSVSAGNTPGGALLAQKDLTVSSILPTEYIVAFADPTPQVQSGDGIFVSVAHLSGGFVQWTKSNANPYPGGHAYLYSDTWYPLPNDDTYFISFIAQTDTLNTPVLTVRNDGRVGFKNYLLPEYDGATGQVMVTDGAGSASWSDTYQMPVSLIQDRDGDTRITTEETPDEDIIRFFLAGNERMGLKTNPSHVARLEITNPTSFNTLFGDQAGKSIAPAVNDFVGYANTYVGHQAGFSAIGANNNTGLGAWALHNTTGGSDNTGVGKGVLFQNTTGQKNTAMGSETLGNNTTGHENVAIGSRALADNVTGSENIAIGSLAQGARLYGSGNVSIGASALYNNHSGENNVAVGRYALAFSQGSYNTAVGAYALVEYTTGTYNTATGYQVMRNTSSGSHNAAFGRNALYTNTTGAHNTALGQHALYNNTTAANNTAVGSNALYSNTTGANRTALGYSSNSTGTNYTNSTGLGYNADCTASNQVRIGNSNVTSIGGFANWTNVSDGRFKQNVADDVPGIAFINRLRPVTYQIDLDAVDRFFEEHYNERDTLSARNLHKEHLRVSGFIAQEVEAAAQATGYDFSGVDAPKNADDFYGLRYAEFVVPLVKAVQELSAENAAMRAQLQAIQLEFAYIRK